MYDSASDSLDTMQASLSEMIPPGALVMLSPVVVGVLFGTRTLAGLLAGALVSGVQMAVSMSNTGGAWDNAKKYVEVRSSCPSFCSPVVVIDEWRRCVSSALRSYLGQLSLHQSHHGWQLCVSLSCMAILVYC